MKRVLLIVLDSVGIGGAPDAELYGDAGSDTIGHIAEACARGDGDKEGMRSGPLRLPNLSRVGLAHASRLSNGVSPPGLQVNGSPDAAWGVARERSKGKDTPSGHWEIAGVPVPFDWSYFPDKEPCFPAEIIAEFTRRCQLPGILGNKHASGTVIINELGDEHITTGKPICYTSADSVFQIAAHENQFGLERLYEICTVARELLDPLMIGRVIARPFVGSNREDFRRTANRRDYAVPPPEPTILDRIADGGNAVIGVGKISDIFAHQGVTDVRKAAGNDALFDVMLDAMSDAGGGDLIFVNFVDFDMHFGHRRDVPGYAASLEAFDRRIPEIESRLQEDDLVIITADHGCDPTWRGTDHTREQVPVLAFGPRVPRRDIGVRETFADIGETVAAWLGLRPGDHGCSFF